MTSAPAAPAAPDSILVYVGLDLIGDGVMKLPFLNALRAAFPQARITWLAGQGRSVFASSLAPLAQGLIDEVIEDQKLGVSALELLGRPLRGRAFVLVIDTQKRGLTSLILRRVRHRRFISATGGWIFSDAVPPSGRKKNPALTAQLMALLEAALGAEAPMPAALTLPEPLFAEAQKRLPDGGLYIGIAPGAGGKHKCWPLERFLALGQDFAERGMVPVFFTGPAERQWDAVIHEAVPEAILPLTDSDPPPMTIALASRLSAAVANDSGTGHMLAAGGAPLLSLFGPTDPRKFAPLARRGAVLRAQDYGDEGSMAAIPKDVVRDGVFRLMG